tara:strand:- start:1044 stop:1517 length:474 start_codon:yes stop_codon:yes gene_type:complete
MPKEHGLLKYSKINILTTESPSALIEKIRENPKDYERYEFYLKELHDDPSLNLNVIEMSRVAAILMQLEKYDGWAYEKTIDELSQFESTNERMRKLNEYILNWLYRSRNKDILSDSVNQAKEVLLELRGDEGGLKVEWKKGKEAIDVDYEEVEENDK